MAYASRLYPRAKPRGFTLQWINFMRYQKLNRFSDSEFKRLVGVPRQVFTEMVEVLEKAESLKKNSGRPHTLDIEDQLLLTLNYSQTA